MVKSSAELMLERETRVSYGPVRDRLFDDPLSPMSWQMDRRQSAGLLRSSAN